MLHHIDKSKLGPAADPMTKAIESCVHCGFCLPACPTYLELGEEMDSPRGRIFLMKDVLEEKCSLEEALPYVDKCLGCLGCVTACPSGVQYDQLITPFRALAEGRRQRSLMDRFIRWFVLETLPYPFRFRWGARLGSLSRPLKPLLPRRMAQMLDLLPAKLPPQDALPRVTPSVGSRRARVALLAGCAQQVLAPEINRATIKVLAANGVEVLVPASQGCCGALAAHTGAGKRARKFARHNLTAFPKDVDAIVTNAAGCGSGMHEYPLWLKGEPEEAEAQEWSKRVCDVSVFLDKLGLIDPKPLSRPMKVAYHDACHLAHAQGVRLEPRRLLSRLGNVSIAEIPEGEICCGSAGTYNIEQPETANKLGRRKVESILSTGAEAVVSGNIGCLTQIRTHLEQADKPLRVMHTFELLAMGYES